MNVEAIRKRELEEKRKYGYCHKNLVGMHLVDQGVADTRAIQISKGLQALYSAVSACDEWQLKNLIKKERHIVEMANWFAEVENLNEPTFKDRTFTKELEEQK
tara:strand:- start:49 stop:357 length:309 start_codon:yes stop_codon:yes gene_type:complete